MGDALARKIVVEIEVPEGVELTEETERLVARMARAAVARRLELLRRLDELIPEPLATEEEIMEMDREIKRTVAGRLKDEPPNRSGGH